MRLIARSTLVHYWGRHPKTKVALQRWVTIVREAQWASMADVKSAFPNGSILGADRFRFEICFNDHRLIAAFDFRRQISFIKFVGTHKEYDAIDVRTVAHF